MHLRVGVALLTLTTLVACGQRESTPEAKPNTVVNALTNREDVAQVRVDVNSVPPVTKWLGYDNSQGKHVGAVAVPPGTWDFTVTAFDANGNSVATGQALGVTITDGATTYVTITIFDTTGAPTAGPNPAPIIASVGYTTPATMGVAVPLTVTAIDPNGDPITYEWTQVCTAITVGKTNQDGVFSTPDLATTDWTHEFPDQSCVITIHVFDDAGGEDSKSFTMTVEPPTGEGAAVIEGVMVQFPQIGSITVRSPVAAVPQEPVCIVGRYGTDGSCHGPYTQGRVLEIQLNYVLGNTSAPSSTLTSSCAGSIVQNSFSNTTALYTWTEPSGALTPTACIITGFVTNGGMTDNFPIGLVLLP